jgi:hypothetical protein
MGVGRGLGKSKDRRAVDIKGILIKRKSMYRHSKVRGLDLRDNGRGRKMKRKGNMKIALLMRV